MKNRDFLPMSRFPSNTIQDKATCINTVERQSISTHMRSIEYGTIFSDLE